MLISKDRPQGKAGPEGDEMAINDEGYRTLSQMIVELGRAWAKADVRPRLPTDAKLHWDRLTREWADSDLPFVVRKSNGIRGKVTVHTSGRKVISADNSIAQWAYCRAMNEVKYSIADIRDLLDCDKIPFAYATTARDKSMMDYKCTLSADANLNKLGWKLCHLRSVGLRSKTPIDRLPIDELKRHFCDLLMPSNHFLVPLRWQGLGELPEVICEVAKSEV
jgi:hypothetical protein